MRTKLPPTITVNRDAGLDRETSPPELNYMAKLYTIHARYDRSFGELPLNR
jgi:hypothetical protein